MIEVHRLRVSICCFYDLSERRMHEEDSRTWITSKRRIRKIPGPRGETGKRSVTLRRPT